MNCFTSVQKETPKLSLWGNSITMTPRQDDTWLVVEPTLNIEPSSTITGGEQALDDFMRLPFDFDSYDLECKEDLIKPVIQKDSTRLKCQRRRKQETGPDERLSREKHPLKVMSNRSDTTSKSEPFHNSGVFEETPQFYISSFSRMCKPVPDLNRSQVASWGAEDKSNSTAFHAVHQIQPSNQKKLELKPDSVSNSNCTHRSIITPRPRNGSSCKIVDLNLIVPTKGSQSNAPPISNNYLVESQPADKNQHETQSILQPRRPNSARVIVRPGLTEPVQLVSKLHCDETSPIINFSLKIPEMPLTSVKIRPKTATHALHTKPCWPSGMRTGLKSRTVMGSCDDIHVNRGLVLSCGAALESAGRARLHVENTEKNGGSCESNNEHDLVHYTAHSSPLHTPTEVERWSALPPCCGESYTVQFPRVPESPCSPAVRPGSALRPWSGRAKKGELSDHSIDQLGKESKDTLRKAKPMKQVGTTVSQSQQPKKVLPRKEGNEAAAVPTPQISNPPQLEHMLSLATAKTNSTEQNNGYSAQNNSMVCFVCSACGSIKQDGIQVDVKQPPSGLLPNLQQSTSPVLVLNYIRDKLSPCNAVTDCEGLESDKTLSALVEPAKINFNITAPVLMANQERETLEIQNYTDSSQGLIQSVEVLVDKISKFLFSISSQVNCQSEKYCSLQVEASKNESKLHAQEKLIERSIYEAESLKQNIHELESIIEHLDLKSKTTQIMEKWELNKKMIGLSERAVLNSLASALVIQEKFLQQSKLEAQTIMHKAESVWEQQKMNAKLDQDLATRELQCRLMETLLAKRETELNSRHSALRTELELAVGDQVIEKSVLLKECRLLVVDNERLKLKLLELESQIANAKSSGR
jgi:hypothetical protein